MNLIADVGGTNTRCALVDEAGTLKFVQSFPNEGFSSLYAALQYYIGEQAVRPVAAAIAVAAPVIGDSVSMTNRQWHFSTLELQQELGLETLEVMNDFTAVALALPCLTENDLHTIGHGRPVPDTAMATLGPGTGLGVSGLIPRRNGWVPLSGEGGHVSLAAATERESEIIDIVRKRFGHCSAERLLSGPGIVLMYNILRVLDGKKEIDRKPNEVSALYDQDDRYAVEAINLFFALLGSTAGNLALTLGALNGVYIAGGIAPVMLDRMDSSDFRMRFETKGRYAGYMQAIPTYVITHDIPALVGLASVV